jgi:YggT family protein
VGGLAGSIDLILRGIVLAALAAAAIVALTSWLVREGRITPLGGWATSVRRGSDPVLRPLERMLVRQGRNPQEAPFWLMAVVVVAGIITVSLGRWLTGGLVSMAALTHRGPRGWLRLGLELAFNLLLLAIVVRVIGSWIGLGRYHRWMKPVYSATDWLVEPIRRRLPAVGAFDLSPLVAYIVVLVARSLLVPLL